jgi:hypothetical protein
VSWHGRPALEHGRDGRVTSVCGPEALSDPKSFNTEATAVFFLIPGKSA